MTDVPSNLIPTRITQLPLAPVADENSLMMIVYQGNNYQIRVGDLLSVAGVPTTRQVIAGTGMTGGGQLSSNVTLSIAPGGVGSTELANTGVTPGVYGTSTNIPVFTVDAKGRVTAATTIPATISGYVPDTRQVIAGPGLTGGGALSSNVTLSANLSNATPQAGDGTGTSGVSAQISRADHVHPAVDLSDQTQVDGILPMDQGGTGRSLVPNQGAIVWSGADGLYISPPGVSGQVLVSGGTGAPTWGDALVLSNEPANVVYAGPVSGAPGPTSFRSLVADDLPSSGVSAGTYGSASSVGTFTANSKGQVTSASSTPIAIVGTQITSGTVPTARLASGTANSTTFLRGDQTWAVPSGGGGGVSYEVGQIVVATEPPSTGTWLETGKYYSKAAYSALSSVVGSVPDIGANTLEPQATLPVAFSTLAAPGARYVTATDNTTTVLVGNSGYIYKSTNGTAWTPVISPWTSTNLREVRYLNNNFVVAPLGGASSNGAVLLYSADGTNFTLTYTGLATAAGNPVSVAYGSGRYVCINGAASSGVAYSSDLINWTIGSFPSTANTLNRVIFANGIFVAVGTSACFTSVDGITWTSRTIPTGTYQDVIYANGLYVAYGTSIISTSSDGVTWTSRSTATAFNQIIYANSLFVAVGTSGVVQTSIDGLTWTTYAAGISTSLNGVCWNGTNYVIASNNGRFFTSPDGATWAVNLDASLSTFNQIDVVNGKTIAFGANASVVLAGAARSTPLLNGNWQYAVGTTSAVNPRPIAYNGSNQYVVGGNDGCLLTSTDGNSWTGRNSGLGTGATINGVFYLNGNYIGIGSSGLNNNLVTSADGITWAVRTAASGAVFNAAAFGASTYVIVGASVQYSTNLVTWTVSTGWPLQTANDVIFANGLFVAVGGAGAVATSPDGITWTSRSAGSTQFNRIIYSNSLFVAIGNSGIIYTSADGVTWTLRTSNVTGNLLDVVWNGSIFCAVGASGVITTSSDGTTWTARTPGDTTVSLMSVTWSGTRFVVTNSTNAGVWTSTDGISWSKVYNAAPSNSPIRRTSYLGGRFISVGGSGGFIETSTDGLTWRASDEVQYVPSTVNYLQKLNGIYFAQTNAGIFQSSDGIVFTAIREISASNVTRVVAYGGGSWVIVCSQVSTGLPLGVLKSTNGTTWSKSADLFGLASTASISISGLVDCIYANGNFMFGTRGISISGIAINSTVYTSSDAITWTPRLLPYGTQFAAINSMASDGSTALALAFAPIQTILRSTDGGVTWSNFVSLPNATLGYSDGLWAIGNVVTDNLAILNTVNFTTTYVRAGGFYVHNNQLLYSFISSTWRYLNKVGGAADIVYAVPTNLQLASHTNNNFKAFPARSNTLLAPNSTPTATNPLLISEYPLYSYDTGTTFWVPPQAAGGGQIAYIYAGP